MEIQQPVGDRSVDVISQAEIRHTTAGHPAISAAALPKAETHQMSRKSKPWKVLRNQGAEVKIYRGKMNGALRYQVAYYTDQGRIMKTRTSQKEALDLADESLRLLVEKGPSIRTVTSAETSLLERLAALGEPAEVVSQLEFAIRELGTTGASLNEAIRFYVNHAPGGFQPATVQQVFEKLKALYAKMKRSPETRRSLRANLRPFVKEFGPRRLDSISVEQLEEWAHSLQGAPRYQRNIINAVITLQRQAQRWKHLPFGPVPAALVAKPAEHRKLPEVFTPQECADCLKWLHENEPTYIPFFALAAFAGLRPSEICRRYGPADTIRWEDIDFALGHIRVRGEVVGKTGEPRFVPIESNLAAWLTPRRKDKGRVCRGEDGYNARQKLQEAKVISRWPPDVLRHSYATYHYAVHQNFGALAANMGNSEAVIRRSYKQPRLKTEGQAWFGIYPPGHPGIVQFKQSQTQEGDNHPEKARSRRRTRSR
jgi:integrase